MVESRSRPSYLMDPDGFPICRFCSGAIVGGWCCEKQRKLWLPPKPPPKSKRRAKQTAHAERIKMSSCRSCGELLKQQSPCPDVCTKCYRDPLTNNCTKCGKHLSEIPYEYVCGSCVSLRLPK